MAPPIIEVSEEFLKTLDPKQYTLRSDLEKTIENEAETNGNQIVTYFSMPESDGRFKLLNGYPENTGRTYYKVTNQKNASTGKIEFVSQGERDRRAINRYEGYLQPVCSVSNYEALKSGTQISMDKPGKVHLSGESWLIDKENKVKITIHKF